MKSLKPLFSLCIALSFYSMLHGQNPYYVRGHIPAKVNGNTLNNPFQGGLNSPQFANFDINNDGRLDIVVFDRNDNKVFPYIRATDNSLSYAPNYEGYFPPCKSFLRTADLNSDGKLEVFTLDQTNNFRIFKNTNNPTDSFPHFFELGIFSQSFGHPLIYYRNRQPVDTANPYFGLNVFSMSRFDLPSITDFDGDGDLDILFYDGFWNIYSLFKDVRAEKGWDKDTFEIQYMDVCYGYFYDGFNGQVNLGVCPYEEKLQPRHSGGSTSLVFDNDEDGDLELVMGNVGQKNLTYLGNGRKEFNHIYDTMISVDTIFPPNTNRATSFMFPAGHLVDVDNDGVNDLVVSPNGMANVKETENVWYYKNNGKNNKPAFQYQRSDLLVNQTLDMGARSSPAFMDVDADGDMDLLVAANGDYEVTGGYKDRIFLFENKGSKSMPLFELVNSNYLNLIKFGLNEVKIHAADVDGDKDIDLLAGSGFGRLYYFRNTAGLGNAANLVFADSTFINPGSPDNWSAAPSIIDYNKDNLPDLLLGNYKGDVALYSNTGTIGNPVFTLTNAKAWQMRGNEWRDDVTPAGFQANGYSTPFAINLDTSAAPEILVGTAHGELRIYKPEGRSITDSLSALKKMLWQMTLTDSFIPDLGSFLAPAAADLDGDSIPDIVVGNSRGGLILLTSQTSKIGVGIKDLAAVPSFRIYPNPAGNFINIERTDSRYACHVILYDLAGRELKRSRLLAGEKSIGLDLHGMKPGIYLVSLKNNSGSRTEKVLVQGN